MICFCVYAIDVVVVVGGGSDDCIFRFHRIIRYFYAMNERRTSAVSFYAMNQQVDSKFQRCVPIQMTAFFSTFHMFADRKRCSDMQMLSPYTTER